MKKILGTFLAICMTSSVLTSFASPVMPISEDIIYPAEASVETVINNEPTPEMMEAMIKKVRPRIDVPEDFKDFSWHFNSGSYYSLPSWNFTWLSDKTGEINVRCDSYGNITSYRYYDYLSEYKAYLPKVSPEKLEKTALEFIKKTAPYLSDTTLVLTSTNYSSLYNPSYTYIYTRYENDIPVPEQTVSVSVNHVSGKVESFSASFTTGLEFKKNDIISPEKAKEILSEKQNMVLSYRLKTEYDDEGKLISRKAYLVYTPEIGYISVDAVTGEIYTERNTWTVANKNMATGSGNIMFDSAMKEESADMESGAPEYRLSEEELAQLAVLENLITKDEAIAVITGNEKLYLNPDATAVEANLSKQNRRIQPLKAGENENEKDFYVWNISFSAPYSEEKYYYAGMYATVDAQTGELISFNADVPNFYYYTENELPIPELKFSDEEALKISEEFLKEVQPEKSKLVRHSNTWNISTLKYIENADGTRTPVYGNKNFNFVRVNDGIDFTYNNLETGVDLVTGKITRYCYEWYDDVEFESPKDAIGAKEALMALYSYDGFGINYEVNSDYTYNKYIADENKGEYIDYNKLYETHTYARAVYSAYNSGTTTIRALDGKMIDYSGEEYKEKENYSYSDISSHWAEDTILSFSYAGIGFEGGLFQPNENITAEELQNLYSSCRLYTNDAFSFEGENSVSRMEAVKFIISALGYSKVANLENVFITDFADNLDLRAEDVGYAAIARGFGLIQGDGENFFPYETLTRAEALTLVQNVITLDMLQR